MESNKKSQSDKIEEEMKLLIEKLNNENAALNKILSLVGEKEVKQVKGPEKKSVKRNQNSNK